MILRSVFIFLLTVFSTQLSAQQLIYIPDANLRKALKYERCTTKDSLDTYKIRGRLQLELNGRSIENLDGLQYFKRLWRLEINNNNIEQLIHLPPNLTSLSCNNNKLTTIDSLPEKLKILNCSNNKIHTLENLPELLESINFSNNALTYFPKLPDFKLHFVNYYNNAIPNKQLPIYFTIAGLNCSDSLKNCLLMEYLKEKVIFHSIQDTVIDNITKIEIEYTNSYFGGVMEFETINFTNNSSDNLVANEHVIVNKNYNDSTEVKTATPISWKVRKSKIKELLKDIYDKDIIIPIDADDSTVIINLNNKAIEEIVEVRNSHSTSHYLTFYFYTPSYNFKIMYNFSSTVSIAFLSQEINMIQDWLYMYKLVNLCFQDHKSLNKEYFSESNLNRIIKWHNDYDEKSKSN
jgi:hypothetical protein